MAITWRIINHYRILISNLTSSLRYCLPPSSSYSPRPFLIPIVQNATSSSLSQLHRISRLIPLEHSRTQYAAPHFDTIAYVGKVRSRSSRGDRSSKHRSSGDRRSGDSRTLSVRSSSSSINMKAQHHGTQGGGLGNSTLSKRSSFVLQNPSDVAENEVPGTMDSAPPSVWTTTSAGLGSSVGSGMSGRQVRNTPSITFQTQGASFGSARVGAVVNSWKAK